VKVEAFVHFSRVVLQHPLTNSAFGEDLFAKSKYDLTQSLPNASSIGSVVEVRTGEMWSLLDEMSRLQKLLDEGKITSTEYTSMLISAMGVNSWKSGLYPITTFRTQDVDYIEMINKLPDYCDLAIEAFLNNDCNKIYEEYRGNLMLLCALASDVINPSNISSPEAFRKWCENYLTKMRNNTDFTLYLNPVYKNTSLDDGETTTVTYTGEWYTEFKTSPWIGSMQKAQSYINAILTDNGKVTDVDTLDIWGSAKDYLRAEIIKDYGEDSPAVKFAHNLFGDTNMNTIYTLGELEEGGLYPQPLPDAFNTQGVILTEEDLLRSTWKFTPVNAESAVAVAVNPEMKGSDNLYYTTFCSPWNFEMLSPGMKAYVATDVNYGSGAVTLQEIPGTKIPANTPVVISTESPELANNKILPIEEEVAAVDGNLLEGNLFAQANGGHDFILSLKEGAPAFTRWINTLPANNAFINNGEAGINTIFSGNADGKIFDLQGREVKDAQKGIFIINGKKVVRF
ncbi:MAG: hypothetical protein NC328_08190, partial [Muribaculum sp.]|nr:hypothetical protein [Muribaculum sp.]